MNQMILAITMIFWSVTYDVMLVLLIWLSSIVLHEVGHYDALMKKLPNEQLKKTVQITFMKGKGLRTGQAYHYLTLSNKDKIYINLKGISSGLFIILASLIFFNPFITLSAFILYLTGCINDMKRIWRYKHEN